MHLNYFLSISDLASKAFEFANSAHKNQKTLDGKDYITHCAAVAEVVLLSNSDDIETSVVCALLHDVIEDTTMRYDDIETEFGSTIADGVLALSKNTDLIKSEQLLECLERLIEKSFEIQLVKLADRIVNISSVPTQWKEKKRQAYKTDAEVIAEKLNLADSALHAILLEKITAYNT